MQDPIIISYKLTTNVSVTYYGIQQYPVSTIYNKILKIKYLLHKLSNNLQHLNVLLTIF